ncbi:MAG: tetratricopeptide repeat protein [Planctomycetota bacterium]|nr:tetratricopeptide repeat protein [Planctomycetota bacterium]
MNARRSIVIVLLVLVTTGAYWGVQRFDFVAYDDPKYVYGNDIVLQGLTWEGVGWAFTTNHASNWHPLTWISHMVDVELFGDGASLGVNPGAGKVPGVGAMHLVNLGLHVLSVVALFLALHSMTRQLWVCAFIAALFALHPTRIESVAWISERKDVLSGLFWMLTIWAYAWYAREGGAKRYALVMVSLALGLLAKPMLVTLPCVLMLLDVWPLKRLRLGGESLETHVSIKKLVIEKLPLLGLVLVSVLMTMKVQQGAMTGVEALSMGGRLENAIVAYTRYLGLLFYPLDLAVLYPYPDGGRWPRGIVFGAAFLLLSIAVLAILLRKRHPWLGVGWLWYLGSMVPVIGLVQVGAQSMADRYTYLPFIGLFIMLAWPLKLLVERQAWLKWPSTILALALLGLCFLGTRMQLPYWANSITLFERTLEVTKDNWRIHNNLGVMLRDAGDRKGASMQFTRVMEIRPHDSKAQKNLIFTVQQMRELGETEAADLFSVIARMYDNARDDPENPDWAFNLGVYYARLDEYPRALEHLHRVLEQRPDDVEAILRIGGSHQDGGDVDEAMTWYRKALAIDDQSPIALNTMAWLLATHPDPRMRDGEEAIELAQHARDLMQGEDPAILLTLAAAHAETGRFSEAIETIDQAQRRAGETQQIEIFTKAETMRAKFEQRQPWRDDASIWR